MDNLKIKLANILEVNDVQDEQILEDFECWDSLTVLSIIALASESYSKEISADQIRESKTIKGLVELIIK
ncbi:MAG: phosphopantetheine-binding protein [Tenuifilaceae bacterium]